jgi:hypothetical protein
VFNRLHNKYVEGILFGLHEYWCVNLRDGYNLALAAACQKNGAGLKARKITMSWISKLVLGILTALAMLVLTFALPKGNALQNAQLVQFPLTVGVWAIFVLLFVKLK